MAKKRDKDLLETLRKSGLRKKVAQALTRPDAKTTRGKQAPLVTRTVENLRTAALELEKRVRTEVRGQRRRQVRASWARPDAALPPAKPPRPGRSGASLRQLALDGESSR